MGHSQSPLGLVSAATASAQQQSGAEPARCQPTRRRKVFYLLDSLNIGGTEVQAVELATRLSPVRYEVLGYLRTSGPPAAATAFVPVIISSQRDLGQLDFALAAEPGRNGRAHVSAEFNFQRMIEKTDRMYTELLHSQGAE